MCILLSNSPQRDWKPWMSIFWSDWHPMCISGRGQPPTSKGLIGCDLQGQPEHLCRGSPSTPSRFWLMMDSAWIKVKLMCNYRIPPDNRQSYLKCVSVIVSMKLVKTCHWCELWFWTQIEIHTYYVQHWGIGSSYQHHHHHRWWLVRSMQIRPISPNGRFGYLCCADDM